jgi:transposase
MKTDKTTSLIQPTDQQEIIRQLSQENQYLKERLNLLLAQLYGKKSEKQSVFPVPDQISFFEDSDKEPACEPLPEKIDVLSHTRKKAGRTPLPAELPRVDVVHDIPEDQKQCACGSELSRIGEEVSEQLNYVPARLEVIRHIRPKYACKTCEGVETEGATVKIAPVPRQIIEKSIASPGLLAHIITAKFVDALPFYRQEKQFARLGYEISRSNMANWTIQLGQRIEKLLCLLKQDILSGPLIQMDETTLQVLKEKGRLPTTKSYMWVLRGGAPGNPGIYFHYSPTRASSVAQNLLQTYQGVVQTDGYTGYDFLYNISEIGHAGCWAHARRKFMEVLKAKGKYDKKKAKSGHAEQAVDFIGQLYGIEHKADKEELSPELRVSLRMEKARPVLDTFHKWLTKTGLKTPPKGLLGNAIGYTLKRWEQLTLYVNHGFVTPDNNRAENAIRPFVVGRKNWLFNDTPAGAKASAGLYSLIETARANNLNPFEYLKLLFEKLPFAETDEQLRPLLPQYHDATEAG